MFANNYYMPIANLIYVSRIIRKTADRERIMRHTVNQSKDKLYMHILNKGNTLISFLIPRNPMEQKCRKEESEGTYCRPKLGRVFFLDFLRKFRGKECRSDAARISERMSRGTGRITDTKKVSGELFRKHGAKYLPAFYKSFIKH